MINTLLIYYDLAEPGLNREALIQQIKSFGKWARIGNAAYLIVTDKDPVAVRNHLSAAGLGSNDRIFVGVAPAPSAWRGLPEEVDKWILANQK
jgi:hypothetical protein